MLFSWWGNQVVKFKIANLRDKLKNANILTSLNFCLYSDNLVSDSYITLRSMIDVQYGTSKTLILSDFRRMITEILNLNLIH